MSKYPHVPAAFINVLAEGSTKTELIQYLQEQWNETCFLKRKVFDLEAYISILESQSKYLKENVKTL